jgi:hypothetical protein
MGGDDEAGHGVLPRGQKIKTSGAFRIDNGADPVNCPSSYKLEQSTA